MSDAPAANYLTVHVPDRELWTCVRPWDTSEAREVELAVVNDGPGALEIRIQTGAGITLYPLPPGQWVVMLVPDECREYRVPPIRTVRGTARVRIGAIGYQRRPGPSRYPAETLADHSWFPSPRCS